MIRAGRPEGCLPLLIEVYERLGGTELEDVAPRMGCDDEEPYAWDECYADDPC